MSSPLLIRDIAIVFVFGIGTTQRVEGETETVTGVLSAELSCFPVRLNG